MPPSTALQAGLEAQRELQAEGYDPGYVVSLDQFSGPMDLLLFLVRRTEVDITAISIAEITDQFVASIAAWQDADLEQAGDFIVMAAALIEHKARLLAPPPEGEQAEGEDEEDILDPAADLVQRLLAYRRFKEAAALIQECEARRALCCERLHREDIPEDPHEAEGVDLGDLHVAQLHRAFELVMARISGLGPREVALDDEPLAARMQKLIEAVRAAQHTTLQAMLAGEAGLPARVGTVMATLESARQRFVELRQAQQYGEVGLRWRDDEERARPPVLPPAEPEPAGRRRRSLPLVTFAAPPAPDDGAEAAVEEPYETEEQRFLRELDENCDLSGVLARAADVEGAFRSHLATEHPEIHARVLAEEERRRSEEERRAAAEQAKREAEEKARQAELERLRAEKAARTEQRREKAEGGRRKAEDEEKAEGGRRKAEDEEKAEGGRRKAEDIADCPQAPATGVVADAAAPVATAETTAAPEPVATAAGAEAQAPAAEIVVEVQVPVAAAEAIAPVAVLTEPAASSAQPAEIPQAPTVATATPDAQTPEPVAVAEAIAPVAVAPAAEPVAAEAAQPEEIQPPTTSDAAPPAAMAPEPVPEPVAAVPAEMAAVAPDVASAPVTEDPAPAPAAALPEPAAIADTPVAAEPAAPVVASTPVAKDPAPAPAAALPEPAAIADAPVVAESAAPVVASAPVTEDPAPAPAAALPEPAAIADTPVAADPVAPVVASTPVTEDPAPAPAAALPEPAAIADAPVVADPTAPTEAPEPVAAEAQIAVVASEAVAAAPAPVATAPTDMAAPAPEPVPAAAIVEPAPIIATPAEAVVSGPAPEPEPSQPPPAEAEAEAEAADPGIPLAAAPPPEPPPTPPPPAPEPAALTAPPPAPEPPPTPHPTPDDQHSAPNLPHSAPDPAEPMPAPPSTPIWRLAAALLLVNALAWAAWWAWFRLPREVVEATPAGMVAGTQEWSLGFNLDMCDTARPQPAPQPAIEPAVAGSWRWVDARHLAFAPAEAVVPGTDYRVRLGGLASRDGFRLPAEAAATVAARDAELLAVRQAGFTASGACTLVLTLDRALPVEALRGRLMIDGARLAEITALDGGRARVGLAAESALLGRSIAVSLRPARGGTAKPLAVRLGHQQQIETASAPAPGAGEPVVHLALRDGVLPSPRLLAALAVQPAVAFSARPRPGGIDLVGAFAPGQRYTVSATAAWPAAGEPGDDLPGAFRAEVAIPARQPSLALAPVPGGLRLAAARVPGAQLAVLPADAPDGLPVATLAVPLATAGDEVAVRGIAAGALLRGLPPGTWLVRASAPGAEPASVRVQIAETAVDGDALAAAQLRPAPGPDGQPVWIVRTTGP